MFPCEKCGCCCRLVGRTPWGKWLALPDGVCRWLDQETNLCRIYEERPLFCNVDRYFEEHYKDSMSREDFYALNQRECAKLQKQYGGMG